jgi:hypothetical protein
LRTAGPLSGTLSEPMQARQMDAATGKKLEQQYHRAIMSTPSRAAHSHSSTPLCLPHCFPSAALRSGAGKKRSGASTILKESSWWVPVCVLSSSCPPACDRHSGGHRTPAAQRKAGQCPRAT